MVEEIQRQNAGYNTAHAVTRCPLGIRLEYERVSIPYCSSKWQYRSTEVEGREGH